MNIKIDGNKAPGHLTDDIGLCFYEPRTEQLREFDNTVSIVLGPFERTVRRFYVVKPSGTIQGQTLSKLKVKIEASSSSIEQKVKVGQEDLSIPSDFSEYQANNEIIILLSEYSTGIIPIDVLSHSLVPTNHTTSVSITLEVS